MSTHAALPTSVCNRVTAKGGVLRRLCTKRWMRVLVHCFGVPLLSWPFEPLPSGAWARRATGGQSRANGPPQHANVAWVQGSAGRIFLNASPPPTYMMRSALCTRSRAYNSMHRRTSLSTWSPLWSPVCVLLSVVRCDAETTAVIFTCATLTAYSAMMAGHSDLPKRSQ